MPPLTLRFSVVPEPVVGALGVTLVSLPLASNTALPMGVAVASSELKTFQVLPVASFSKYRLTGIAVPWVSYTFSEVP